MLKSYGSELPEQGDDFMKLKNIVKRIEKDLKKDFNACMFLLAFAVFVYGLSMFWSGFHTFDMAQNLIFIRDDVTIDLLKQNISFSMGTYLETTTKGYKWTLEETYINGVKKILLSINVIVASMFVIGYYFRKIEGGKL